MELSKHFKLTKETHPELGEIFVLKSSVFEDGGSAYFIDTEMKPSDTTGKKTNMLTGVGIRISQKTAVKLAWQILRSLGAVK